MTAPDTSTAPTVAPVIGKRCRLRNGEVTGTICEHPANPTYPLTALVDGVISQWTVRGSFDRKNDCHPLDIIAILDDEAAPEAAKPSLDAQLLDVMRGMQIIGDMQIDDAAKMKAAKVPDVAQITGYLLGDAAVSVRENVIVFENGPGNEVHLTIAQARALLQVLPALIEIAEGKA